MTTEKKSVLKPLKTVLTLIAILWLILFLSYLLPFIKELGIRPRNLFGLIGILTSPFIHDGFFHLIANTSALLILGTIFIYIEKERAAYILVPLIVLGGLGTWIIGRSGTVHIGASGVVYGLLGYLLTIGIFRRSISTILISILVFILYGGTLFGILPVFGHPYVSWEGHLCGFISGIAVGWSEAKLHRA